MFLFRGKGAVGIWRERRNKILKLKSKERRKEAKTSSEGNGSKLGIHRVGIRGKGIVSIGLLHGLGTTALRSTRHVTTDRLRRNVWTSRVLLAAANKDRNYIFPRHPRLANGTGRVLRVEPAVKARPAVQVPALRDHRVLDRVQTN